MRFSAGALFAAALVLATGATTSTGAHDFARTVDSSPTQAGGIFCKAAVNDPHFSKGAGGAIFKTDVTCTGTGPPTVEVRVQGYLSFATTPSAERQPRASSDQTQTVVVNGPARTYYTPQVGSNGGRGTGAWFATATAQAVAPIVSNIDDETRAVEKTI